MNQRIEKAVESARNVLILPMEDIELEIEIDELQFAAEYLGDGLVVAEGVAVASAQSMLGVQTNVNSMPCKGWCITGDVSELMRFVGNDMERTVQAAKENLQKGLESSCPQCGDKHFIISEALEHHAQLLIARRNGDDAGVLAAARLRGNVLKQLGSKVI